MTPQEDEIEKAIAERESLGEVKHWKSEAEKYKTKAEIYRKILVEMLVEHVKDVGHEKD